MLLQGELGLPGPPGLDGEKVHGMVGPGGMVQESAQGLS